MEEKVRKGGKLKVWNRSGKSGGKIVTEGEKTL